MTFKDQWNKIKENWLLAVILVLVVGFLGTGNVLSSVFSSIGYDGYDSVYPGSYNSMYAKTSMGSSMGYAQEMAIASDSVMTAPRYYNDDFAPQIQQRMIAKTTSLNSEVERGMFYDADKKLKSLLQATDALLLSERINKYELTYGSDHSYLEGTYQIKVESKKYAALVDQLKDLGDVQYFNENAEDVTEQHTDLSVELEAEKSRLQRFKEMLAKAENVQEQMELTDRIFNIERTISYYEDSLKNIGNRVDYSTIYLTLREKQSNYAGIAVTTFSQLLRNLVDSFNGLLSLIFWLLPWLVATIVVWIGVRFLKKKRK